MANLPTDRSPADPADDAAAHAADHNTLHGFHNLIDAAGDLIVGTGVDSAGKLAKGAALEVLRVNSGATALEWAAPSGGGGDVTTHEAASDPHPGYLTPAEASAAYAPLGSGGLSVIRGAAGLYVYPTPVSGTGSFGFANGDARMCPFRLGTATAIDRIGCEVVTAGSAGALVRLGIYNSDPTTGAPDTLNLDAGTVGATTTGAKEIVVTKTLAAGLYWLLAVNQGAPATTPSLRFWNGTSNGVGSTTAPAAIWSSTNTASSATVTGALPAGSAFTFAGTGNPPLVYLRTA